MLLEVPQLIPQDLLQRGLPRQALAEVGHTQPHRQGRPHLQVLVGVGVGRTRRRRVVSPLAVRSRTIRLKQPIIRGTDVLAACCERKTSKS